MMVLLFIPLGILCFILAYQCLRAEHKVKALWCAALGVFFLCSAAVMGYGVCVLLQNIEPKNFDRATSAATPASVYTGARS
ncbi:MAG: hypothetical protein WC913_02730 [Desulfuromonas sp.]